MKLISSAKIVKNSNKTQKKVANHLIATFSYLEF